MKKVRNPLFLLFICLAIFGFLYQLITDPRNLFSNIAVTILVIAIFWGIYRYLTYKQRRNHRYPHRQKQKGVYSFSKTGMASTFKKNKLKKEKKSKDHPFKVIEGSKGKKNKPYSS